MNMQQRTYLFISSCLPVKWKSAMIKASDLNAVIWKVLKHKSEVILNSFLQSNPMSKVHILVRKSGRLFCVVD